MQQQTLNDWREKIQLSRLQDETDVIDNLVSQFGLSDGQRNTATQSAKQLVSQIRKHNNPGLMEVFLAEYGLSTDEGVALMCLAEALLRVPDTSTMDELIEDKIVSSSWRQHKGKSSSVLVNAATWGLMFTGKVLDEKAEAKISKNLKSAVKRLGEPLVRAAVKRAMKEMGHQFVLGESIESALERGQTTVKKGYRYSYDMLGEAAMTAADAEKYYAAYEHAIRQLSKTATASDCRHNPGISIKLSALHPRYESTQYQRVLSELVPKVIALAKLAKQGNLGLNIDAEEAQRLDISLDVIANVLADDSLTGWDGFGVVVQAYNKSASYVLDWLYALAEAQQSKIMVRLVKGAYWDSEIKLAQVEGSSHFPVYTQKNATDIAYLCCANKMLNQMSDRIYAQFATHNANTIAAILAIAPEQLEYEFQRLHGMGGATYEILTKQRKIACRIYAPVGEHEDLLAYLVRRLLENGANSSFVNQLVNHDLKVDDIVCDPFAEQQAKASASIVNPSQLFMPERVNSKGWALYYATDKQDFENIKQPFFTTQWHARPILVESFSGRQTQAILNPADLNDSVGEVIEADREDVASAIQAAKPWLDSSAKQRAQILEHTADLLEKNAGEIFAILAREAGKNCFDAVAELREAVDFLRYYAAQAKQINLTQPRGIFVCISPWNFPLAIFCGQIAAALAAGNGVLAKPAESTPLIAYLAVTLFHQAGVPVSALQLLPGLGHKVGSALVSSAQINGVCFTGSTSTAININRNMAQYMAADTPIIAETGGINAMLVDSTALPEQAVRDIVRSAFQSAGQRCSALRVLFIQEDIYPSMISMLSGAIDQLHMGNPWQTDVDLGPLISKQAHEDILAYIQQAKEQGRVLKQLNATPTSEGYYLAPTVIAIDSILNLNKEIFGPVLHVVKYAADELEKVIAEINLTGYGLTFGMHTRIDSRVEQLINKVNAGNIYVNRDQIGAIVGSQPFGGEGLSGTGPKAGGPNYLSKFMRVDSPNLASGGTVNSAHSSLSEENVQQALNRLSCSRQKLRELTMPGPTGESNRLTEYPKGVVLCLGPSAEQALEQARVAKENACPALIVCPHKLGGEHINGFLNRRYLSSLQGFSLVALFSDSEDLIQARQALAARSGVLLPLCCDLTTLEQSCRLERHVCVDTTAAGGNTSLLAAES